MLTLNGLAAHAAVTLADAGKQHAEVIIDFRGRGHGTSRIVSAGPLFDGDGGCQPFDAVQIGFGHLFEELASVCRQGLDVFALTFGIDGIEGQRAFARSA